MSAFTRVGSSLWDWEPWTQLDDGPRNLWLALYTTAEAKRIVPGLWHGSITSMAEAAKRHVDETRVNLDKLLDADLVEFDIKLRVLRLTMLPDAGESPANPNVLRGWFRKFTTVPSCAVRDAHVPVIRWLMDTWSRENAKPVSIAHEQAWNETFGRIAIPAPRKRGVRSLTQSDTSTAVQPSLFSVSLSSPPGEGGRGLETVSHPQSMLAERSSVDNSDSLHQSSNFNIRGTVSQTVSKRYGSGSGLGSGSGSQISERGGVGEDEVDRLLATVASIVGGSWKLPAGSPARVSLSDQVARLGGLDLALLGSWWRSKGLSSSGAREVVEIPGVLIAECQAAERWRARREVEESRAAEASADLRSALEAVGLRSLVP